MSKGRLTRHELSWLLTQEAQNAAERLRVGVQFLRTQAPPPPSAEDDPAQGVETSLDALDDVMRMLSSLNQRASAPSATMPAARRGRIDVAALLVELAPGARVSIEPGSGTEIYGDEADLRRMFQVLVGHGSGKGDAVTVRREGDEVKVSVALGPDSSPTAETERAWLSRIALRYGGHYELEGGSECLVFPADGASDRNESAALRKELDEARRQGEAYARELAAVFDRGEQVLPTSTIPPAPEASFESRLTAVSTLCRAIASDLRGALGPVARELASMRRHEVTDEQVEGILRRVSRAQDVVTTLATFGEIACADLGAEVDLVELAESVVRALGSAAAREDVTLVLETQPKGSRVFGRGGAKELAILTRQLVAHAIDASPRGATVFVTVMAAESGVGPRLVIDDAGPSLPATGRRAFAALESNAGAYGRPSGLPLFLASEIAVCQGATLELCDAPMRAPRPSAGEGASGLRVVVTFAPA